ncbi:MAG: GNAT family N-acetyltransferase [Flavobacteriales bacterium]|nr:GNAT family N-acetyltransferase [Flavobacteriales bacterium]
MNIQWRTKPFDALSVHELHDLLRLRSDVFVVEQQCVYPDLDGLDQEALHLLGTDEGGALIAYARILPPHGDGHPHIGRVVVHPAQRGRGLAHALMREAMTVAEQAHPGLTVCLSAQSHLEGFYNKHGFQRMGLDYDLDGIPHVDMIHTAGLSAAG